MNHRQELKTLLKNLDKTPTGVLDKNIVIALKALDERITALDVRITALEET